MNSAVRELLTTDGLNVIVLSLVCGFASLSAHAQQPQQQTPRRLPSAADGSTGNTTAQRGHPIPMQVVPPKEKNAAQQPAEPPKKPFHLKPEDEQRLARLLTFWEQQSNKVKTFSCRFELLRYDTIFGPPNDPKTKSDGTIRYAAPDKGVFRVEHVGEYTPPKQPGAKPTFEMKKVDTAEHWVCDGSSIYEFDARQKQLIERILPPGMQGKEIAEGPLPFIFGATRAKIESRYWIRELFPPAGVTGEYWFEAFPKRREEAGNFKKVMVILEEKTFLPKAMQIFPPTYDPQKNRSREVFVFSGRQVNNYLDRSRDFMNQFISPKVPFGWKKVTQNFGASGAPAGPQAAEVPRQRAQRQ